MYFIKQCPMCHRLSMVHLNDREASEYIKYSGLKLIQDILPDTPIVIRELLLSGYCIDCQNIIFCSNFVADEFDIKY